MNLASAWKGIKQRINWALNKSEHLSVPERQKQREIKSAKQIAIVESALIELEEIKKVVENWDEGEYYTDSIRSMKKIEGIIKGEME